MADASGRTSPDEKALNRGDDPQALAFKVRVLSDPSQYRHGAGVETVETHFSWVFFVGGSVYKLKKPIKKSYLDLSTVALRRHHCEMEVILNQRLTQRVYIGVLAFMEEPGGGFYLTPLTSPLDRCATDYVVHQRRLDRSVGMVELLEKSALKADQLESLAWHLAAFYRRQAPVAWNADFYRMRLRAELLDCSRAFLAIDMGTIPIPFSVIHTLDHFLQVAESTFGQETILSRIVEGHGDLRPEHIFFEDVPQIIDCLEFSYDLRCRDSLDEVAYLAMECEVLGHKDEGDFLIETFRTMARIRDEAHLSAFYAAFRALVRAKLVAWRLADKHDDDLEVWRSRLRIYWDLAEKYAGFL